MVAEGFRALKHCKLQDYCHIVFLHPIDYASVVSSVLSGFRRPVYKSSIKRIWRHSEKSEKVPRLGCNRSRPASDCCRSRELLVPDEGFAGISRFDSASSQNRQYRYCEYQQQQNQRDYGHNREYGLRHWLTQHNPASQRQTDAGRVLSRYLTRLPETKAHRG